MSDTSVKQRARRAASRALSQARAGDWLAASATVQALNAECGSEGTMIAVGGWCDTLAVQLGLTDSAEPLALAWIDQDTRRITMSDGGPDRIRWAGQLIVARAAMDEPMFTALVKSLPRDPKVVGSHVGAVLECVATTLNDHEAGGCGG